MLCTLLPSGTEAGYRSIQNFYHFRCLKLRPANIRLETKPQARSKLQLCFDFQSRPSRHTEEVNKFTGGETALTFSNVARYRY